MGNPILFLHESQPTGESGEPLFAIYPSQGFWMVDDLRNNTPATRHKSLHDAYLHCHACMVGS